ncbi:hypothetical protein BT96DRAFT_75129 [Gymnopus androsaceus JB14]|uniref:Uncharacterized protein n=1 Tax=Gymnopus androsaceus JB14 TaxID=1447944 RepID=A0A6A4HH80_9AGAR|nr:hypothetical protein BT96DRAFT_75129 [Gymnopus androsaceus JB14]
MKVSLAIPLISTFFSQISRAASVSSYNETALLSFGAVNLADWQEAYQKAVGFVFKLTNEEKIELITRSDITSQNLTALDFDDNVISPPAVFLCVRVLSRFSCRYDMGQRSCQSALYCCWKGALFRWCTSHQWANVAAIGLFSMGWAWSQRLRTRFLFEWHLVRNRYQGD